MLVTGQNIITCIRQMSIAMSSDCKHRVVGAGVSNEDLIVAIKWIVVIQHMFYLVNKYMLWFVYDILYNTYQPIHLRKTMDSDI